MSASNNDPFLQRSDGSGPRPTDPSNDPFLTSDGRRQPVKSAAPTGPLREFDTASDPFLLKDGRRPAVPSGAPPARQTATPPPSSPAPLPPRSSASAPTATGSKLVPAPLVKPPIRYAGKGSPPPAALTLRFIFSAPLAFFVSTALIFALLWRVPVIPLAEAFVGMIACNYVTSGLSPHGSGSRMLPPAAGFIGVAAGALTGLYAHEAYVGPFFAIALGREYRDVAANSPVAAYADAGKIFFAETSQVDSSRAVGYRDINTYCVAPVMDSSPDQSRRVGFWAVGLNCCEAARGDFQCGAASKSGARGGVRLADDGILERSRGIFLKAVDQAAAVSDLAVEDDPVLVHWVEDPAAEQRNSVFCAFGVLLLGVAFFALLVFTVVAASALASTGE